MTVNALPRSRGVFRPSFASSLHPLHPRGRREGRVPAGTHGPLCEGTRRKTAQRHTGEAEHTAFPAQWVDGLCRALPGAEFVLASLASRIDGAVRPVGLACTSAKSLTVATTVRTTRFCRTHVRLFATLFPGVVDVAGRMLARRTLSAARPHAVRAHRDYPPCPHLAYTTLPRPPQPGSRIETTYDRPILVNRDGRHIRLFRISVKWNIFAMVD